MWHMLQRLPGYLPSRFSDAAMSLNMVELGVRTKAPRWQRCIAKASSAFGFAASALYIENAFQPERKKQVFVKFHEEVKLCLII